MPTPESEWTGETLTTHFQTQLGDLKSLLDERYQTQMKATDAAFAAQQTAMQTAFQAADKAVDKALDAAEKAVDKALEAAEKAVDRRQDALDREFHEHLAQVRHENALAFNASNDKMEAALASAKEAVTKAEGATEKRFASVNEFREQLRDQASLFMARTEAVSLIDRNAERVSELQDRLNRTEGKGAGYASLYGWAIGGIGLLISVVIAANVVVK